MIKTRQVKALPFNFMSYIKMHGKALDGSGETVETEVHPDNVAAFKAAGWTEGGLPETEDKPAQKTEVETVKSKAKAKPKK